MCQKSVPLHSMRTHIGRHVLLGECARDVCGYCGGHDCTTQLLRNTQGRLVSLVGRGGGNCRITPGPHTQLFGGARPPPPGNPGNRPPRRPSQNPPLQAPPPPPRGLRPTVSWGGSWRPGPRGCTKLVNVLGSPWCTLQRCKCCSSGEELRHWQLALCLQWRSYTSLVFLAFAMGGKLLCVGTRQN